MAEAVQSGAALSGIPQKIAHAVAPLPAEEGFDKSIYFILKHNSPPLFFSDNFKHFTAINGISILITTRSGSPGKGQAGHFREVGKMNIPPKSKAVSLLLKA
ncbi:MAG: hypothetical protein K6G29_01545, partial [Clostridiales bacterium]|nr:hypothetical protein [Clostridiales bacterium]